MVFHLLPVADWSAAGDPAAALPTGRVYFYREGTYTPELVLQANRPGRVPPGSWVWIAESEGYVSVLAGTLEIPPDVEQTAPKRMFWPVVPACRMVLDPDAEWSGVQRLDVVSSSFSAVYPVDPRRRRELWVPSGRLLTYSVGTRGLLGIDDLGTCAQNQVREVEPPAPPGPAHQELMVTATLPDSVGDEERADLSIALAGPRARELAPSAEVRVGRRVSAFFLEVPSSGDLRLTLRHPKLRTRRTLVESLGGSARELPEQRLEQRLDLTIDVDYRPLRQHDRAELRIHYCGFSRHMDLRSFRSCELLDQRPVLRAGLHPYTFESLDDGRYSLEAWIDRFVVPGLAVFMQPYLDPESDQPPRLDRALLHELEIHGSILLDGEPEPGVVSLLSLYEKHRRLPDLRFRSDDSGSYRLYYFGRLPGPYARPPGFEDSSNPEDLLGIYGDYQLVACTAEGFCRPFSVHTVLQGEGRLDLELGDGTPIEVAVTDGETGEPIADALVSVPAPKEALYFHHGEVDGFSPKGSEGSYVRTDGAGEARLLADARADRIVLTVHHDDYETVREGFPVVPGNHNRLDVVLGPREERAGTQRFLFPDGSPVTGGFLLVFGGASELDGRCSVATSAQGFADLQPECLIGSTVVLVAPGARIATFEGTSLTSFDEVTVQRAPSRPLRLRVQDEDGNPVAGVPLQLRYPDVVLGPNHVLMAATATGYQAFYLTDERGELTLRGVDPEAVTVPEVGLLLGGDVQWESLTGYRAGETATLTVAH